MTVDSKRLVTPREMVVEMGGGARALMPRWKLAIEAQRHRTAYSSLGDVKREATASIASRKSWNC